MRSWIRHATERIRTDNFLPELIYDVDLTQLSSSLASKYFPLHFDEATNEFLLKCYDVSFFSTIAANFLNLFMSVTDTNGILGRGQMFVVSQAHVQSILQTKLPRDTLLDVGAGDGNVTSQLAPLVRHVQTTEVSSPMVNALNSKGFNCINTTDLTSQVLGREHFDIISCLNVLDRADTPCTLLQQMYSLLDPQNGLLLLAVVLPFSSFVEHGTEKMAPKEVLPMNGGLCSEGSSFENSLQILVDQVLTPMGYEVVSFARVPYISQGDMHNPYFVLDDAILVLKRGEAK